MDFGAFVAAVHTIQEYWFGPGPPAGELTPASGIVDEALALHFHQQPAVQAHAVGVAGFLPGQRAAAMEFNNTRLNVLQRGPRIALRGNNRLPFRRGIRASQDRVEYPSPKVSI